MDSKEAIKRIKIALGLIEKAEVIEIVEEQKEETVLEVEVAPEVTTELKEGKLQDGTVIEYDKLEVGGKVSVKTDPNTSVPVLEGEYVIEDGTKIKCDASGIIIEIEAPEVEQPAEPVIVEEVIEVKEVEQKSDDIYNEVISLIEKLADSITKLSSQVKELETAPSTEPVHFSVQVKESDSTLLEDRIKALKQIKKQ